MGASAGTLTSGEGRRVERSVGPAQPSKGARPDGGAHPRAAVPRGPLAHLLRCLPLSLLVTAVVTVVPIELAAAIVSPGRGVLGACLSAALAVALSVGLASGLAAAWKRWARSRELLFADLLLWGWLRRCWAEWRLRRVRAQFESVAKTGSRVSIELLERVTRVLQARDAYTHGHSQRVARHAVKIARALRLPAEQVAKIRAAAAVHDVGKLYTPQAILNNPGRLSDEEFEIVKRHAADGADMVGPAGDNEITAMVRHHHERLSGRGYPDGLAGEQIPLGARVIAVADSFDAITSTRPYRKASSHKTALDILQSEAGNELDADVVAAFRRTYSPRWALAWSALATLVPQRALAFLQASGSGIGAGSLQVLPVLGAAGALALAHGGAGHKHATPARAAHRAGAVATARRAPVSKGSGAGTAKGHRHASPGSASPRTRGPSAGRHAPSVTPTHSGTPKHEGGGSNGSSHGSSGSGAKGGTGGGSGGGSGGSEGSPPAKIETTPLPPPPSVPESPVPVPTVTVPTVTVPSTPLPVPEAPSLKTPSATMPSVEASLSVGSSLAVG